ncbi:tRNA (carboxymethyluridine(34)-5-O)-methyltransferase [Colletotrichum siamense]|uniref:tRNA (Carboxymethyluridine(34)-5-O)-methyltransferase n=1 Tax=Colletotrichum siamense TaxID=690259 RepID=A0A9P5EKX3_COLSI|nr:tRNA (carboxymethyluridine(34)-5-O)-methyltransferase [Colletotrichum siamense]KAF4852342.1 tRNA (carboxymethyluridine(34)-5-O)-methyltransferase [Colletotrichum siamense]
MGASSGPQPGSGTAVPAADPHSPEPPSALGDSSAAAAAATPSSAPTAQTQTDGQQEDAESYESRHVHTVYEAIAPHFSSTRYKPWPLVSSFLLSLAPGSVGLDAGCGNGKYIGVNPSLYIIASDRSANLVSLARDYQPPFYNENAPKGGKKKGGSKKSTTTAAAAAALAETAPPPPPVATPKNQVLVADSLALPYRPSAFDFAISIAVIHHMSTRERRRAAVAALLSSVRPGGQGQQGGGKVLVMVWALEQGNSRRGWDAGADQDQLVSWVTKGSKATDTEATAEEDKKPKDTTYQRYYHLYREGELEEDVVAVGGRVLESGYERDNWWAVFCRDS